MLEAILAMPSGTNGVYYDPEFNSFPYTSTDPQSSLVPNVPLSGSTLSPTTGNILDPGFNVTNFVAGLNSNTGQYDPEYNSFPYTSTNPQDSFIPNVPLSGSTLSPTTGNILDPGFNVTNFVAGLNSNTGQYDPEYNSFPYTSTNPQDSFTPNVPLTGSSLLSSNINNILNPGYDVYGLVGSLCNTGNTGTPISNYPPSSTIQSLMTLGTDVNAFVENIVSGTTSNQFII